MDRFTSSNCRSNTPTSRHNDFTAGAIHHAFPATAPPCSLSTVTGKTVALRGEGAHTIYSARIGSDGTRCVSTKKNDFGPARVSCHESGQRPEVRRAVSSHETFTGKYTWPRFEPSPKKSERDPELYVDYFAGSSLNKRAKHGPVADFSPRLTRSLPIVERIDRDTSINSPKAVLHGDRTGSSGSDSHHGTGHRDSGSDSGGTGDLWMKHAVVLDVSGPGGSQYSCTWYDPKDRTAGQCGYTSKKHLVKRHIESKHLQIRPLTCEICNKSFSQKSNYSTHMNTHTKATPHQCVYCDATFGDPARRHRHMKAVHNHISHRRKTQTGTGISAQDTSDPEEEESS